jgi:hypothetical protein
MIAACLLLALVGCGDRGGGDPGLLPFKGSRTFQALLPAPESSLGEADVGFMPGARMILNLQVADDGRTLTGTLTSDDGLINGAALQQVRVQENEFEAQVETTGQGSLTVGGTFIANGIMFLMTVSNHAGNYQLIPLAGRGMEAPLFATNDSAGNPVVLPFFRGQKNVVLNFFRGKT